VKLSDALEGIELELRRDDAGAWRAWPVGRPASAEAAAVIERWSYWLAVWWRQSPTSISECNVCGEIKVQGAKDLKRCVRGLCSGQMEVVTPTFTKKRPRGKKVKL
jgi:hypothetical protein